MKWARTALGRWMAWRTKRTVTRRLAGKRPLLNRFPLPWWMILGLVVVGVGAFLYGIRFDRKGAPSSPFRTNLATSLVTGSFGTLTVLTGIDAVRKRRAAAAFGPLHRRIGEDLMKLGIDFADLLLNRMAVEVKSDGLPPIDWDLLTANAWHESIARNAARLRAVMNTNRPERLGQLWPSPATCKAAWAAANAIAQAAEAALERLGSVPTFNDLAPLLDDLATSAAQVREVVRYWVRTYELQPEGPTAAFAPQTTSFRFVLLTLANAGDGFSRVLRLKRIADVSVLVAPPPESPLKC